MRQGDRSGFRLVIHQRHKRRVFAVRKSHPAFNPILDPRGQFCGSGGGKNHKTCIRGRPFSTPQLDETRGTVTVRPVASAKSREQ
jgi:hypothetical protein